MMTSQYEIFLQVGVRGKEREKQTCDSRRVRFARQEADIRPHSTLVGCYADKISGESEHIWGLRANSHFIMAAGTGMARKAV